MRRLLCLFCLLLTQAGAVNLTVYAASSLKDAFSEVGRAFEARSGHRTRFQFAGSNTLRTQIAQGAPADVFASANLAQYLPLQGSGRVTPGSVFARNRLTLIVPARPSPVKGAADLAQPGVQLVIAAPQVPAGAATRALLTRLSTLNGYGPGYARRVLAQVVSQEPNVRQVALKVQLGQADAAFVYRSDLTPALRAAVRELPLPERFNTPVAYPAGAVRGRPHEQQAREFVAFLRSDTAQAILKKWGFLPAP